MSSVRNGLYTLLISDPQLQAIGGVGHHPLDIYPNFTVDSPAAHLTRWMTIRWGASEAPVGRDTQTRAIPVSLWMYDRERDFTAIDAALKRCREIMASVQSLALPGGGYLVAADFSFSSEDIWDDTYEAVARGDTYKLVTNGM